MGCRCIDQNVKNIYEKVEFAGRIGRLYFLEIYFACNGSVQAISQKLFIHKNTVQYKIKKIADATGYDPRRLTDTVLLYLCVKLRKA